MRSRISFYLVGFTILALVVGAVLRSWVFLVVSIANLSLIAVGLRGLTPDEIDVKVSRGSAEVDLYEGDSVWIELEVENEGDKLKHLEILDNLPADVELVEGSNHHVIEMEEGESRTLKYRLGCPLRGEVDIGPIHMRYRDPMGFFFEEWEEEDDMMVHVLPSEQDLGSVKIRPTSTRNWLGNIRSKNIGIGTEFFSLREYTPGDSLRRINWKATARNLEPISNEYEGERSGDVIIVVDAYREGNVGTVRENTTAASTRAAASLASSILRDRNRVGLIVLGDFLNWVYPSSGRDQFYKIMDGLSKVEEGGTWKLHDAKWLVKRFFPSGSLVIFISPLIQEEITETIIDMCMKEFDVMVLSPDPLAVEKKIKEDYDPMAEQMLRMERQNAINRIWRYSLVVDWDPDDPLEAVLEEVVRFRQRR